VQRYNPKAIEPKWQAKWTESKIYEASDDSPKPKHYILEYFPYPSGVAMHVGHVRNYTIGDTLARFARMNGYNVLHPMGWDAFGLPAENYAIATGISPKVAIQQNTERFKKQLVQMGFGYDWSREFASSDPDYYQWTQWFFLLLFKRGLAYQKDSLQWWCPFDKTVLANEQVENGRCWRCGSEVEKKSLKQWFFKITDYADRLEKDLDLVDWSDSIKTMQRNWIGRSTGAEIDFKIEGQDQAIKVFTTQPDTIFGATFMVLAPEHPLVPHLTTDEQREQVNNYLKEAAAESDIERQETDREKTGVFSGSFAINPANDQKIPIWIADYVLGGYGTGAIMAVPAHDERDHVFAEKFNLPIVNVIAPVYGESKEDEIKKKAVIVAVKNPKTGMVLVLNWGPRQARYGGHLLIGGTRHDDEDIEVTARREIAEETGYTDLKLIKTSPVPGYNHFYSNTKNQNVFIEASGLYFELQSEATNQTALDSGEINKFTVEWYPADQVAALIDDGIHAYFYKTLVLGLAMEDEGIMVNSGAYNNLSSGEARHKIVADLGQKGTAKERVNYKLRDWLISRQRYWGAPIPIIYCDKCGIQPVPEDQLPVKLPELSSYEPSGDGRSPLARVSEFVNTTCPKCGGAAQRETDTMDGFACSSWYFLRFADPHNAQKAFEPTNVKYWLPVDDYIGGAEHAVMHLLYARMWTKVMADAGLIDFSEPFKILRNQGMILGPDGQKMSKSKNNTIEPDGLIEQGYGADAIRILELFIGPWDQSANWSVEGLGGAYRFLQRVWTLAQWVMEVSDGPDSVNDVVPLKQIIHRTTKKVSHDLTVLSFNTAIATMMEAVNELYILKNELTFTQAPQTWRWAISTFLQLLSPFAPHLTEELWSQLGQSESIHISLWPAYDEQYLTSDTMTIVVQINGKLRAELKVVNGADETAVVNQATTNDKVKSYLEGKDIKKTVYVPGKLVNFVV
jgi:leucyl-tRNA synthetase